MIRINSNGSKWSGAAPDPIAALLLRLATDPLDPSFGDCVAPARLSRVSHDDDGKRVYIDMGPMYPEAPSAVRFFGNFANLSAVFSIDTDEPELIETLTQAIRANQASPAYQALKEPA